MTYQTRSFIPDCVTPDFAIRNAPRVIPVAAGDGLGSLEWEVVEIGRWDGASRLNPDGLLARMARILLGFEIARPLANRRLEALRRFAAKAWFRRTVRERDLRAFIDAGFSWNDAGRVLAYVGSQSGRVPSVEICRA